MSIGKFTAIFFVLLTSDPNYRLLADSTPVSSGVADNPSAPARKILPSVDDDDDDNQPKAPGLPMPLPLPGRCLFELLDHRSSYGKDFFPDPFLGPEFDRETQIELDYAHGEARNQQANGVDAQLEWNFLGQFTLAGEFGYDSAQARNARGGRGGFDGGQENGSGFENVDLALFHPVFQAVNKTGTLDYTAVLRLDVGIPTATAVSGTDVQFTPYLGQLLRVGEHISVETWTGPQFTIAPHQTNQFISGVSLGYKITRSQAALPLTKTVTPLFELDGQTPFSGHGRNALFGVAGFNWQSTAGGELRPRIGVGYQFPIGEGAREQLRWGIITQIFLDF